MHVKHTATSTVALVPWDPLSPEHIDRLTQQRVDCGWHIDKPSGAWKEAQQGGIKCIYWLPSGKEFFPVGHIALDISNFEARGFNLNLPEGSTLWIKSLFISKALRSSGIGRAAMDKLEGMATSPPLSATTLMLDTLLKDDQIKFQKPKVANQDWYARRGYRLVHTEPGFYEAETQFYGAIPRTVFMRKDL
ncbi:Putative serine carboxypeptidase [Verticillium dahliae VDG2]|nr:Putative serine carboxypeptidase [Verticillium dahliae VDG2]